MQASCPSCGVLQPPPDSDEGVSYFDVLGIVPALATDSETLRERLYDLSRRTHPDRFAVADARTALWAARWSTLVNRAYQTLKDPERRTKHLAGLYGLDTQAPGPAVPLDLAETYFELQEQLAESADTGELIRFRSEIEGTLASLDEQWERVTRAWVPGAEKDALRAALTHWTRRRFLHSMLADLENKLPRNG